jgi:hypothetical protein
MNAETRFTELQRKAREAEQAARSTRAILESRYQAVCYAPIGKRKQYETLQRKESAAFDRFYKFLESISPRAWNSGVPLAWLRDSLTYADAVTRGQLSTVPPPAWGFYEADSRRFAEPVREARV